MNLSRLFLIFTGVFTISGFVAADQTSEVFEKKISETLHLDYLLSLPDGYQSDTNKKWPLVVFLHGSGERGTDVNLVAKHGPPKLVAEGKQFPFILASPQCPKDSWWSQQPVLELIDFIETKYRVDPSRVYLTGLSMGGYGTWEFACRAPERFAAIVPICGGGVPYRVRSLAQVPVWVFHGGKDTVVPLEESSRLVDVLKKIGNEQVKFTIDPEAGHDSWSKAYADSALYDWLLAQSLKPPVPVAQ